MIELEERVRRGLNTAAATQVVPPNFEQRVTQRVTVVRRRRVLARSALAAAAVMVAVVGAVAVVREDSPTQKTVAGGPGTGVSTAPGWRPIADAPIAPRFQALSIAMDDRVLVWGGSGDNSLLDGAVYDAAHDTWTKLPDSPLPSGDTIGAWTGREAIVVSGETGDIVAAAYDPQADTWRTLAEPPLTNASSALNHAVWTGTELVVVGIANESDSGTVNQVAIYDPSADSWRTGSLPGGPLPAFGDAVWTGTEVAVVGHILASGRSVGRDTLQVYDPASDEWREIPWGLEGVRDRIVVAWTGNRLFVGGGSLLDVPRRDAALVDLAAGIWDRVPDAPVDFEGNSRFGEIWTGRGVLTLNGGDDEQPLTFDPVDRAWSVGPSSGEGFRREEVSWAWVEPRNAVVVWSGGLSTEEGRGVTGCCTPIDRGRTYTP
jgi:hypothetical protein